MTRVAVTSLVRRAGLEEASGYLNVVDLGAGRVLWRGAVPESAHRASDPNPRGGVRGAKGVAVHGDRLVVANSERLFVLDDRWQLQADLTHPLLGGVHDVLAEDDGVRVCCSACDVLAHVGWDGALLGTWTWRDDPALADALGHPAIAPVEHALDHRDPLVAHRGVHDVVHLNAVTRGRDGLVVSLGRILPAREVARRARRARVGHALGDRAIRAVRRLRAARLRANAAPVDVVGDARSARVLLPATGGPARLLHAAPGATAPTHGALEHDGALLYLDSAAGDLVVVADGTERRIALPGAPAFPRGLAACGPGRVLVGSQRPLAVHEVDVAAGAVVRSVPLGGEPAETVYAVALVPDRFGDPAQRPFASAARP